MHYIHQNAWRAGLVKRIEDWKYSSFLDYSGLRNGTLCNKKILLELTGYDLTTFYKDSYETIQDFGLQKGDANCRGGAWQVPWSGRP